ncbi:MAG: aminopeptidase N [Tetrasphaera sp.]|nr:aminopeptidase N [Tetrasphaera sp.]
MPGTNLTHDEARTRAALVSVESYRIDLDLTASETTFPTTTTVTFGCREPGAETFIDFVGVSVEEITLNGRSLDPSVHYADSRIALPDLAENNLLIVTATGGYTNTGEGLHRFVDPVDEEVYLYSQFEVPDSRRVFAVFEQPDLKATYEFVVTAPSHWRIVSNTPTPEPEPVREGVARWHFPVTQRFSSYISALVAGPYDVVTDSVTCRAGEIPLAIYCRKSLTPYLDAEDIFALTRQGFAWFEEEFDQPYPFTKYDQIFTPEYNAGAMENVGCVTIHEKYVFRSKPTEALVERRALTILHELAHMWFGDLVTMRWWNDLWLNESFAEWASTACQAEATRWSDAWTTFTAYEKDWAYRQDQLSSTHPIVADIRDLHDVFVNFDGITYAKGAAVLKQLVAYVGREHFREGVRAYFAAHAWGNTTLDDLLRELEAASGRDLRTWSRLWLETASVNILRPVLEVDAAGIITSAAIEQCALPGFDTLRPHRLAVGLYAVQGEALVRTHRFELDVDGPRTEVPQLLGMAQPDLLLVNDDDLAYAKVRLDERSAATALAHPRGFGDSLPRTIVLASLWDMTRDAELPARDFIEAVLATLPGESDSTLLTALLGQLTTAVYLYTDPAVREERRATVRERLWDLARTADPGSDAQLQLVSAATGLIAAGDDAATVLDLLSGAQVIDGLDVDFDVRWRLIIAAAAAGAIGPQEVEAERDREDTVTARERAATARAALPRADIRDDVWHDVLTRDLPNAVVESAGLGFTRLGAPRELLEAHVGRYHDALLGLLDLPSLTIAEAIARGFYPRGLANAELLAATDAWLEAHPDAPDLLRRVVRENRDPIARALAAQARDAVAPE